MDIVIITKVFDKIKLAKVLRIFDCELSTEKALEKVNNLPLEIKTFSAASLSKQITDYTNHHLELDIRFNDEDLYEDVKYDKAKIWYDSLSQDQQNMIQTLISRNGPHT